MAKGFLEKWKHIISAAKQNYSNRRERYDREERHRADQYAISQGRVWKLLELDNNYSSLCMFKR